MANPSVTNTFANSTTADATQVNQNFTDLVNGLSDGTKDISVNAVTAAGNATLDGSVSLGSSTVDDITVNGSLASSVPVKTTFTSDIGASTAGLKDVYFGSDDSAAKTVGIRAGTVGTSYKVTLPPSAGSAGSRVRTGGSGVIHFVPPACGDLLNLSLAASVGTSALTVALKGADGNDPSATNPVDIVFRSATAATGTAITRAVTSATSVVISSGSTLGHASAVQHYIYVYALDSAGTVELGISSARFDEGTRVTTTAEGGGGSADSGAVMYSTTTRTNVACRLIGRLSSTQAAAGTWATAIDEISLVPFARQTIRARYSSAATPTLTTGTVTLIDFATKVLDSHNLVTTGVAWKFTANEPGAYLVNMSALMDGTTNSYAMSANLYKNGSDYAVIARKDKGHASSEAGGVAGSIIVQLTVGDFVDVRLTQSSGVSLSLSSGAQFNHVSVTKIGEV